MDPVPSAYTKQTPRGSVVVLGDKLLTDEMDCEHAAALVWDLNQNRDMRRTLYADN